MPDILYEDADIIVVRKPAGVESQSGRGFSLDLESQIRNYLAQKGSKTPPYVGVVHRLDRPVAGVMVYAKKKSAAAELSRQVREHIIKKKYLALVRGMFSQEAGELKGYLVSEGKTNTTRIAVKTEKDAKEALLYYQKSSVQTGIFDSLIKRSNVTAKELTLLEISLITGRKHQIRVQLADAGFPILGDAKYGVEEHGSGAIGLCAWELTFLHPVTGKEMCYNFNKGR